MPVVLVTGGSRGIGRATAVAAAAAGYDVAFSYRTDRAAAQEVSERIRTFGRRTLALQADSAVEADLIRLFGQVDDAFGRIDALVNNAGIVGRGARVEGEVTAELGARHEVGDEWLTGGGKGENQCEAAVAGEGIAR